MVTYKSHVVLKQRRNLRHLLLFTQGSALTVFMRILLDSRKLEEHMRSMWGLVSLQEGEWLGLWHGRMPRSIPYTPSGPELTASRLRTPPPRLSLWSWWVYHLFNFPFLHADGYQRNIYAVSELQIFILFNLTAEGFMFLFAVCPFLWPAGSSWLE